MGKLREGSHLRGWAGPLYTNTYVYYIYIYIYVCVAEYMMLLQSHIYIYTHVYVCTCVTYASLVGFYLLTCIHTDLLIFFLPSSLTYLRMSRWTDVT